MDPTTVPVAVREMVEHVQQLVARRRAQPGDDLLTALVHAQEDGDRLSDSELVTMVFALVIAGHETTAHLIGNGTVALLTHPDQLALLRDDPGMWPAAVHEVMRWCGPVTATGVRYAAQDLELGGVPIARGDAVEAVIVSANRDPRVYADPDRFDITRRPVGRGEGHVGFGHGIHYCLGAALARLEMEEVLRRLYGRHPHLRLADTPVRTPGLQLYRYESIPVVLN
jgi:cytochrome P450